MKRLLALVAKDLYLYRWEVLLSWVGISAIAYFMLLRYHPPSVGSALIFLCSLDSAVMIIYGDWLSYFEKSKGTFFWLRTLPISDRQVVSSKFAANALIQVGTFFLPIVLCLPHLLLPANLMWTLIAWFCILAISSFMLLTKLVFGRRFGQVVPLVAVLIVFIIGVWIVGQFPLLWFAAGRSVWTPLVLVTTELVVISGLWYLMCAWVAAKDTPQLVD